MSSATIYLLTGDIGGTNSRMALYDLNDTTPLIERYYRNSECIPQESYSDPHVFPNHIIRPFLQYCWEEHQGGGVLPPLTPNVQIIATLAIAGFVLHNQVRLTNLGYMLVDGTAIATTYKKDPYLKHIVVCRIINDFVAQGYGCLTLKQHEVEKLYGPVENLEDLPVGPKVCVGAGTGLGECYLTPNLNVEDGATQTYTCFASEGGHVEYAPRNDLEIKMYRYLSEKFMSKDRISVERVVSGKGLANVYEFLADAHPTRIIPSVHQEFLKAGDQQGGVIAKHASDSGSLCQQAMSILMSAYGCEAGSTAIKWIPTGGLFVTGGVTAKNIQYLRGLHSDFMISYLNKGRVTPLLEHVPLFAVLVEDLGVRGAYHAVRMEYERYIAASSSASKTQRTTERALSTAAVVGTLVALSLAVGGMVLVRKR